MVAITIIGFLIGVTLFLRLRVFVAWSGASPPTEVGFRRQHFGAT
jgi:hypothetical protein